MSDYSWEEVKPLESEFEAQEKADQDANQVMLDNINE